MGGNDPRANRPQGRNDPRYLLECRKESIRKKSIRKKSIGKKESGKKVSGKKNKSQFHVQRIDKRLCNVILINL